jgi:hypothetical protein
MLPAAPAAGTEDAWSFTITVRNVAAHDALKLPDGTAIAAPIAPGAYAVIDADMPALIPGEPVVSPALEALAEAGDAEPMVEYLNGLKGVRSAGLLVPGHSFELMAQPGDRLFFATMFVQSNDLFYAPDGGSIALFDKSGEPVSGDITDRVVLWDAGTEVNEVPGLGPNQAPRQIMADAGPEEGGVVRPVDDGFEYPPVASVIEVMVSLAE